MAASGYGPWANGCFCGCALFADDIALTSPTRQGLQALLSLCADFARQNLLKFNVGKSKAMVFKSSSRVDVAIPTFLLDGQGLQVVEDFLHLGHVISSVIISDESGVLARCRRFYSAVFCILGLVPGVGIQPQVWKKIMDSILRPILAYGNELWRLRTSGVASVLHATWRRGFRRGLRISDRTSLKEMYGGHFVEMEDILKKQQLLFLWRNCHSSNPIVRNFSLNPFYRSSKSPMVSVPVSERSRLLYLTYMEFKSWLKKN